MKKVRKKNKRKKQDMQKFCAVRGCRNLATENHHFFPVRFFGDTYFTIKLCRGCHRIADRILPSNIPLTIEEYARIIYDFVERKILERT